MKLRNKKTGIIEYLIFDSYPVSGDIVLEYMDESSKSGYSEYCRYKTLAELNEEWEDYAPKEPLIKDEKIRKAVRAWAEVVGRDRWFVVSYNVQYHDCCIYCAGLIDTALIDIGKDLNVKEGSYTFAELCGEEEE